MSSNKEKEVLLSMLEMYKDMPYLWQKDNKDYLNKDMRTEAFKVLLEIYKNFDENATVKVVKKKIENMRTSYTKELKKLPAKLEYETKCENYLF
ncbi:hypothetical protein FQR65_LT15056 [Abscondita terminalis]|nr:hypothetical protein FQR65_LT15056 [Abscondita terminalis]